MQNISFICLIMKNGQIIVIYAFYKNNPLLYKRIIIKVINFRKNKFDIQTNKSINYY